MANTARSNTRKRRSPTLRYFYLNIEGKPELHKVLRINRSQDFAACWLFSQRKRVGYIYTDLRRRWKRAYTLTEVGQLFGGRHRVTIQNDIMDGCIPTPQMVYSLDGQERPVKYMFSEEDIFRYHDYLITVHIGQPRKDGAVTRNDIPPRSEIAAMLREEVILYAKTEDGEFKPVFKEPNW